MKQLGAILLLKGSIKLIEDWPWLKWFHLDIKIFIWTLSPCVRPCASRGLIYLIWLIFLLSVSGTFRIIYPPMEPQIFQDKSLKLGEIWHIKLDLCNFGILHSPIFFVGHLTFDIYFLYFFINVDSTELIFIWFYLFGIFFFFSFLFPSFSRAYWL